jgi:hypothetical protein
VIAATSMVLASCGDDDDADEAEAARIALEVTGTERDATYSPFPETVDAGVAEIELTNSAKGTADFQLIRVEGERTDAEVEDALQAAGHGEPFEDWFLTAGGVGATPPGDSQTVVQELEPGTYHAFGADLQPIGSFEAIEDGGGELPDTEATVTASEYTFTTEALESGSNQVLFENRGAQPHHLIAAPILRGKTIEDVEEFARTEKGSPPIDFRNRVESAVLEGGTSQVLELDLQAGRYALLCFVSDREGGPPHVTKGMVSEATVAEAG